MLKKFLLIIGCSIFLGGCSLIPQKSGIEVISYPTAKVFLDGKEMGMTPYKNGSLKPGEVEVKLTTNDKTWSKKIDLQNNISTVVDWEFGKEEKDSGGYILYLEKTGDNKKSGLLVNSTPEKASISIDGEIKGFSPLRIGDIGEGDKQMTISYPGRKSINVFMRAVKNYQLVVEGTLAEDILEIPEPTPTEELQSNQKTVIIKDTETGWLRVRETASSASPEIAKVKPEEKYPVLDENSEWVKIDLGDGKNGWISASYAVKSE